MFGHDRTKRFDKSEKITVNRHFTDSIPVKDSLFSSVGVKMVDDWNNSPSSIDLTQSDGNSTKSKLYSPGPGSYNPNTSPASGKGTIIFKPADIEVRQQDYEKLGTPGPGSYYHPINLLKPTFNRAIQQSESPEGRAMIRNQEMPIEETDIGPSAVMRQVQELSDQIKRSTPDDRKALKANMKSMLQQLG